jgi:hypothetical protein
MKRTAFEKEEIDGVSRRAGANVKTQEHAESAIHRGVAGQHLPLMEPKAVCARDCDQRAQQPCFTPVLVTLHLRSAIPILPACIRIGLICKGKWARDTGAPICVVGLFDSKWRFTYISGELTWVSFQGGSARDDATTR